MCDCIKVTEVDTGYHVEITLDEELKKKYKPVIDLLKDCKCCNGADGCC